MIFFRVLGITLLAAQVFGKAVKHKHHPLDHFRGEEHHHHHARKVRGYAVAAEPLVSISKAVSHPVVFGRDHVHAAAVPAYYSHAHAHAPQYAAYAAPAVAYAHAPAYHAHAHAPAYYAQAPAYHAHAHAPAVLAHEPVALVKKPTGYQQSIPAAAIRNVETVMVTKTITPVVTKTTTHYTHAEPALSVGHVQGYSEGAVGHAKVAPVTFNTQYTTYAHPTVGVNGPVVYKGAAVGVAPAVAVAGPEPVYAKTAVVAAAPVAKAVVAAPAVAVAHDHHGYHGHGYHGAYLQGAALAYDHYGIDGLSVPVTNFLDVSHGNAVVAGAPAAYVHK